VAKRELSLAKRDQYFAAILKIGKNMKVISPSLQTFAGSLSLMKDSLNKKGPSRGGADSSLQ
jgi:hypothetical protein